APWLLWPGTPLTYFLEGVAARLLGAADAPGDLALFVRWLEAPRRRHTWRLYRRAIAAMPAPTAAPVTTDAPAPALVDAPLAAAVHKVRHRLLGDLELAVSRTGDRARRRAPLPAIDEWREVASLFDAHRRAARIGGDEVRRLAFPHVHGDLTPWLVWLWND